MRSADGWWRRLARDKGFEAEMCERQRQLGSLPENPSGPHSLVRPSISSPAVGLGTANPEANDPFLIITFMPALPIENSPERSVVWCLATKPQWSQELCTAYPPLDLAYQHNYRSGQLH